MTSEKRIGIFGWGLVAPRSPNIEAFEKNLAESDTWLTPFREFGPSNFLVGYPQFAFEDYHEWFDRRFPPSRFSQLDEKMGPMAKYAMGAFIQSLGQNPGMEEYLQSLGLRCHVYVGTGLGELTVIHEEATSYDRARRRWNEFWAAEERCEPLRRHREGEIDQSAPADPATFRIGSEEWIDAKGAWEAYWMERSDALQQYLAEASQIQAEPVPPSSGAAKLGNIREKLKGVRNLNRRWGCPAEPWSAVSAKLLWNIANIPASQISMIGRITGPAYAPIAACASFGVALRMAMDSIRLGEADACVIGMTDPPPTPLSISAFYNANVLASDANVSRPMTGLKGTHVSGGSCIWIVGDAEKLSAQGFKPVGLELLAVGTSSDAHHIITPSKLGPQAAIQQALRGHDPSSVGSWDMHATATPGDATEIEHSIEVLHQNVVFSARKGTFGHGMSVGGGWELTAQHLGTVAGRLFPAPLTEDEIHADVQLHGARFVQVDGCEAPAGLAGKLSMGIGGINSCVVSRPWSEEPLERGQK